MVCWFGSATDVHEQRAARDLLAERVPELRHQVKKADEELDRIIFEVRPTALDGCSLASGLCQYVSTWSKFSGTPVEVSMHQAEGLHLPSWRACR